MKWRLIIGSFLAIVAIMCVVLFSYLALTQATLQTEINYVPIYSQQGEDLNPVPSLYFQQGGTSQLEISLRQNLGFTVPARGVEGRLELPDGFFMGGTSNELPFGSIYPGDAAHCCPMITAGDTVASGIYYAKLVYWGKNVQTQEIDIELIVNSD